MQVLAVSIDPGDDADKISSYQDQYDFRWPMALTSREMLVAYGVRQQSTKFAIDADGIVTYTRGPGNAGEDGWTRILETAAPGASQPPASTAPPAAPPPAPTTAPRPSPAPQPTAAPRPTASPAPPPPPQPAPTVAPPPPTPTATPEPEVAVGNKVGNRAPDFQVTTVDGVTVTPAELKGTPYILYFFATW